MKENGKNNYIEADKKRYLTTAKWQSTWTILKCDTVLMYTNKQTYKQRTTQTTDIPDGGQMAVNMDDIEMRHGAVTLRLSRLHLSIIQVDALRESVDTKHLNKAISL